jgi:hypothetical protein
LRSESTQAISVTIVGRQEAGMALERWRSRGRTGQWARQTRIKARGRGKKEKEGGGEGRERERENRRATKLRNQKVEAFQVCEAQVQGREVASLLEVVV